MSEYLVIQSRDPFASGGAQEVYDLAGGLADDGHGVTLFLVENGVLAARKAASGDALGRLSGRGVTVLADDFSLRERGIDGGKLAPHVRPAPIDAVVDQLAGGSKALWH